MPNMSSPLATRFLVLLILIGLLSCKPWSIETEAALKLAGENRVEFEKVLRHYNEVICTPYRIKGGGRILGGQKQGLPTEDYL